ncbi:MAG: hypothetical protein MJY59_00330 [Bacteroidaceae bacterium]|nr:hypothetical protein [Bacteroidaceae bacterium]
MQQTTQLEDMRQQIALLKDKLDQEAIINDRLLRDAMRHKMSIINRNAYAEYISGIFVITFGSFALYDVTHSLSFIIGTILYMLTGMTATFIIHRKVRKEDISGDLLTVARKMRYVKRQYHNWLYFAIPSVILWLLWFFWEAQAFLADVAKLSILMAACLTGALIGGIIGWRMHRRVTDTCDQLIRQIEES